MTQNRKVCLFLSLKWKLLIGVMLMMICVGGVLGSFANRELTQQQQQQLQQQQRALSGAMQDSIHSAVDKAVRVSHQIGMLAPTGDDGQFQLSALATLLQRRWHDIQLYWDVSAIGVYTAQPVVQGDEPLVSVGSRPDSGDVPALSRIDGDSGPKWQFVCREVCRLQVLIPTLIGGQMYQMLVETGLTDILAGVRSNEELEFVVLGRKQQSSQQSFFWGRELFSISDRQLTLPVLQLAAVRWQWPELQSGNQVFNLDDKAWALWAYPLDIANPSGPVLVVMSDVSLWYQALSAFQRNMLGILLSALLLVGAAVVLLAWSPIMRLERHARILPLLAQADFNGVKRATPRVKGSIVDEVDNVDMATLDVTDKLEHLQQEVVSHTQELERLAMLDMLTGLPNKPMLTHELNKAIACVGRLHEQVALMFLDLDEFRRINDTLGHNEGDELLKIVAARLGDSVRSMDTVFRQGGDEFLILLRGIEQEQEIPRVIHKIFAALQQPIMLKSHKLIITTSIGIAFCRDPAMDADELVKHAELAMYQAKSAGRSNYRVFSYEMLHQAHNRMMIEQDIGEAITDNQLSLYLQPIIDMSKGELRGFEALIRWFHPQRGLIMPGDFIPDIEHSDAIIAVGNYVLKQGMELLTRLQQAGGNDLYLAVNLSAKHYLAPGLKAYIVELLDKYPVRPESLLLEVTEESVIEQVDMAMTVMAELKQLGVRIAIDDFGTGYSSLSYLKQLPFDVLKIDRCFTQGVLDNGVDTHIVTTVIELAHNLEREVVAEGIETDAQEDFMRGAGCELGQGYLYSRPISEEQVMRTLTSPHFSRIWPKAENYQQMGKLG